MPQECNFGSLSKFIIHPSDITVSQQKINGIQKTEQFKIAQHETKIPIIIVINKKSGGQSGQQYLSSFYRYLNPIQVIDLIEEGLEKMKIFANLKKVRVVVCGGDGTVASVINFMLANVPQWAASNNSNPPVAILPLGTGNDLSRQLGWGGEFQFLDVKYFLKSVASQRSQTVLMDRWKVDITFTENNRKQSYFMYNYLGIGLDAKYCLKFHDLRQKFPDLFKSRIGNKFIYTQVGLKDLLFGKKHPLTKCLQLFCDNEPILLDKDLQNLVVMNINYWGGGVKDSWDNNALALHQSKSNKPSQLSASEIETDSNYIEEYENVNKLQQQQLKLEKRVVKQSFNDNIIEIMGINSMLHLGQCQSSFAKPDRVAQGGKVQIKIAYSNQNQPEKKPWRLHLKRHQTKQQIQIDGEPFEVEGDCEIAIYRFDQVRMLCKNIGTEYQAQAKVLEVMDWAEENIHISKDQKEAIVSKLNDVFKNIGD